jgi:rare lipoprotein A
VAIVVERIVAVVDCAPNRRRGRRARTLHRTLQIMPINITGLQLMQRNASRRHLPMARLAGAVCVIVLLGACSSTPKQEPTSPPSTSVPSPSAPAPSTKYYKDDGPGESPPSNLDAIPDATPRLESLNRFANRPYTVLGQDYVPATTLRPYKERGIASWYGRKFHGQKTSTGETYDMYAMTAAHPTLPLPSYARVTSVATGRSVIVRVNDRGPFLHGRIIDLSYAAAHKVGVAAKGSGEVVVEAILPPDAGTLVALAPLPPVGTASPVAGAPATAAGTGTIAPLSSPTGVAPGVGAPTPMPISADAGGGYDVQLGAFQNFANAQNFLSHVQAQLAGALVEPKVREVRGLYRIYVGPYADRDSAKRAADSITAAFGFAAAVAPN